MFGLRSKFINVFIFLANGGKLMTSLLLAYVKDLTKIFTGSFPK